jgi:hypothetical protein
MRYCRNLLHACLAAARKKQKRNCGGVGKRVATDFQGVGNPQNGWEQYGLSSPKRPTTSQCARPSAKFSELRLSFRRAMRDGDAIRKGQRRAALEACCDSYPRGFKGGWKRWSTAT